MPSLRATFCLFLLSCFFTPAFVAAQQAPQRDPQAVATIQQAIVALGGASVNSSISDALAVGGIAPVPGSWVRPASFVWKDAGTEFRREMQVGSATQVFVSGHGRPAVTQGGKTKSLFGHMALNPPFHLPGLVLWRELSDSRYSLRVVGPATVAGQPALHVRTSLDSEPVLAAVTAQDWFFDLATGLPLRVEYRLPENRNGAHSIAAAAEFSDFRTISGVAIPFHIAFFRDGAPLGVATVTSVAFNSGLSPTDFDPPAGGGQ